MYHCKYCSAHRASRIMMEEHIRAIHGMHLIPSSDPLATPGIPTDAFSMPMKTDSSDPPSFSGGGGDFGGGGASSSFDAPASSIDSGGGFNPDN